MNRIDEQSQGSVFGKTLRIKDEDGCRLIHNNHTVLQRLKTQYYCDVTSNSYEVKDSNGNVTEFGVELIFSQQSIM